MNHEINYKCWSGTWWLKAVRYWYKWNIEEILHLSFALTILNWPWSSVPKLQVFIHGNAFVKPVPVTKRNVIDIFTVLQQSCHVIIYYYYNYYYYYYYCYYKQ